MKKILFSAAMINLIFMAILLSCDMTPVRDNPNDPKSPDYPGVIYLFAAGPHNGNIKGANATARVPADSLCESKRQSDFPNLPSDNVRAFITIDTNDEIKDMPVNYQVPTNRSIIGTNGIKIANNWTDLLDGTILASLTDAGMPVGYWWSGSTSNGSINMNCSSWSIDTNGQYGFQGGDYAKDDYWITNYSNTCDFSFSILCMSWKNN